MDGARARARARTAAAAAVTTPFALSLPRPRTCSATDTRVSGPMAAFRASAMGYSMNSAYDSAP